METNLTPIDWAKIGAPLVWVQTYELLQLIRMLIDQTEKNILYLSVGTMTLRDIRSGEEQKIRDVVSPIVDMVNHPNSILILPNAHAILAPNGRINLPVIQALIDITNKMKNSSVFMVSYTPTIPPEIARYTMFTKVPIPDAARIAEIIHKVTKRKDIPEEIVKAATGLTTTEIIATVRSSLYKMKDLNVDFVRAMKKKLVENHPALEIIIPKPYENFNMVAGLDNLKEYFTRAVGSGLLKGILLVGVPGTGKSFFAKAAGMETGLPVVFFNIGRVFNSLVGSSEHSLAAAFEILGAIRPAIVFIDEIEKAVSGVKSSSQSDSGVTARIVGALLTWLQELPEGLFVIATVNNFDDLPVEITRSGRFDAIFYLGLPQKKEREQAWKIWKTYYGVKGKIPNDEFWTPAEIEACVRNAKGLGVPLTKAAQYVQHVYRTNYEQILAMISWARTSGIPPASSGGYIVPGNKSNMNKEENLWA